MIALRVNKKNAMHYPQEFLLSIADPLSGPSGLSDKARKGIAGILLWRLHPRKLKIGH